MDIKTQLLRFAPQTEEEAQVRQKMLAAWEAHGKTLLYRQNEQAHFTASALLLNPAMDKTLMVHHHLFHTFTWTGGHADGEENLLYTAIREAREETGVQQVYPLSTEVLSLDILQVPAHNKKGKPIPAHVHYSVAYGLIVPEKQPVFAKPDENSAVRWIAMRDLRDYCAEPHMLLLYEKLYRRMKALQAYKRVLALLGSISPFKAMFAILEMTRRISAGVDSFSVLRRGMVFHFLLLVNYIEENHSIFNGVWVFVIKGNQGICSGFCAVMPCNLITASRSLFAAPQVAASFVFALVRFIGHKTHCKPLCFGLCGFFGSDDKSIYLFHKTSHKSNTGRIGHAHTPRIRY